MPATATVLTDRATINRANSHYSTGPRTEAAKQRSSQNALRHGLTARTAVLASEDPATYEQHCRQFENEYQPATHTETQLVLAPQAHPNPRSRPIRPGLQPRA